MVLGAECTRVGKVGDPYLAEKLTLRLWPVHDSGTFVLQHSIRYSTSRMSFPKIIVASCF